VLQHLKGDKVIVFKERRKKKETVIDISYSNCRLTLAATPKNSWKATVQEA
jgi:hypothetical protein